MSICLGYASTQQQMNERSSSRPVSQLGGVKSCRASARAHQIYLDLLDRARPRLVPMQISAQSGLDLLIEYSLTKPSKKGTYSKLHCRSSPNKTCKARYPFEPRNNDTADVSCDYRQRVSSFAYAVSSRQPRVGSMRLVAWPSC